MRYCLLLPLVLAACAPTAPTHSADAAAPTRDTATAGTATATVDMGMLDRYHWPLESATDRGGQRIDALFARAGKPLQLDFAEGRLSVANACNRLGGSYTIQAGRLDVGRMMQTMMACVDPKLMALDAAIGGRLDGHPRIELQTTGDTPRLTLRTDAGDTLVFAGTPTAATRYGSTGETVFLEVAAQKKPCSHPLIRDRQCLEVRERHYDANGLANATPGEWHPLYQDIEGYTHEEGVRNVLRVKRYAIKDPPADAPSSAYVLDMIVESELAKP